MSLAEDVNSAVGLLLNVEDHVNLDESLPKNQRTRLKQDVGFLLSVLDSPLFRELVGIRDSLGQLGKQIQEHPSLLPEDFDIENGELLLTLPLPPSEPISAASGSKLYAQHEDDGNGTETDGTESSEESSTSTSEPLPEGWVAGQQQDDQQTYNRPPSNRSGEYPVSHGSDGTPSFKREIHSIAVRKPPGHQGLGLSLVGLRSELRGDLGIYVQDIQPGGIWGQDGRLKEGDQILSVNGRSLDSHQVPITHQEVIDILQQAQGRVELVVARACPRSPGRTDGRRSRSPRSVRRLSSGSSSSAPRPGSGPAMLLSSRGAKVEVIELVNDGTGLGFGIVGGHSTGVVVKTICAGGVADRSGTLKSGDHLLKINNVHLKGMSSDQVAAVLRQAGNTVVLVVARPVLDDDADDKGTVSSCVVTEPELLDQYLATKKRNDNVVRSPEASKDVELSPVSSELPEVDTFKVQLSKDSQGLGVTIAGYVCEKEGLSGIFVKSVSPGSAAAMTGRINVNDQIIEVDGQSLTGYNNHRAVELLRNTGNKVLLTLARYLRGPKYEQLQMAIANAQPAPQLTGYPDNPENVSTLSLISPNTEPLIQKWTSIYSKQPGTPAKFQIIVATVEKFESSSGLGISLEGTVDVEGGMEVRPHHYIRSILPDGPVGLEGSLMPGDELLEVNGKRLMSLSHVEVLKILCELPRKVRIVCARSGTRLRGVTKPILKNGRSRESSPPVPTCLSPFLVKAKSDGSLASSPTTSEMGHMLPGGGISTKSRSLEPLSSGLALWSPDVQIIELIKGDRGLGFSILDYQDPLNPDSSLIVIRSLVPGGAAQADGRLIPGDRLVSVNDTDVSNASLDVAVQALKGAPKGPVRIGICKPLPLPEGYADAGRRQ